MTKLQRLYQDHGRLARTIDAGVDEAAEVLRGLAGVGVDVDDVGRTLEVAGVASFHESSAGVLDALEAKARELPVRMSDMRLS